MNDKSKFVLVAVAIVSVDCVFWFYTYSFLVESNWLPTILYSALFSLAITLGSVWYLLKLYPGIRVGLPLGDERSRQNRLRAGYYSFFVIGVLTLALFIYVLSLPTYSWDLGANAVDEAIFGLLVAMPVSFFSFWLYFTLYGKND